MPQPYDTDFFQVMVAPSARSAGAIVPLVGQSLSPSTVIDLGCGTGGWVTAFQEAGVEAYGVDGDYVDQDLLTIPGDRYHSADLTAPLTLPEGWPEAFDLAISLEVAEHLPASAADQFVETLAGLAPAILFSAAIPHQGGTHHVNEQWPTYWARRFQDRGFTVVDAIRPKVWGLPDIGYVYAQNTLLFLRPDVLDRASELRPFVRDAEDPMLSVVHPRKWDKLANPARHSLRRVLAQLPHAVRNTFGPRRKAS